MGGARSRGQSGAGAIWIDCKVNNQAKRAQQQRVTAIGRNDPVEIIVRHRRCGRNILIGRKAHFLLRIGSRFPPVKPVGLVHRVFCFAGKLVHQRGVRFGDQLPPRQTRVVPVWWQNPLFRIAGGCGQRTVFGPDGRNRCLINAFVTKNLARQAFFDLVFHIIEKP